MSNAVPFGASEAGTLPLPWLAEVLQAGQALQTHSLLLHGAAGAGQFEAALLLAQDWLCEADAAAPRPCGRCRSCTLARQRSHTDLLVLIPEELRVRLDWLGGEDDPLRKASAKPSRDIRIEQVRMAIDWSHSTSARGRGKALVVHPAEALNGPSANALLKTLEEPMPGLRIILTCADPAHLLPTLRSRCQRLPVKLPAPEQATRWLQAQGVADAQVLLSATGGSPLLAREWAAQGMDAPWLNSLPRWIAQGDASSLANRPAPLVLDLLFKLCHDALCLAVGGTPRYFAPSQLPTPARPDGLLQWRESLLRVARHADHPWNAGLLLEALVAEGMRALRAKA